MAAGIGGGMSLGRQSHGAVGGHGWFRLIHCRGEAVKAQSAERAMLACRVSLKMLWPLDLGKYLPALFWGPR